MSVQGGRPRTPRYWARPPPPPPPSSSPPPPPPPPRGGGGAPRLGTDPELGDHQLLRGLRLVPFEELGEITLYPEPFAARLAADACAGFPDGTVHLGTFR